MIGLEIHVQLKTRTKMFCGCELSFGEPPNTRTCPVCLGLPGALPVANAQAVHLGLRIGLALGCELAPRSVFHRKNYFYPDLPKGYQISQYDEPLCTGGRLGEVRIHRVHLEEDAAKLTHVGDSGRIHGSRESVVDFNRGGTPLAEIVTEPDLRSAEQASEWLKLLRTTLRQLGVSDVNMEEGSLRCDANISLRPAGSRGAGHEDRAEEHELVQVHRARDQGRDRPPGADPAGAGGRSSRRRFTSTPPRARSPRCAARRRRTTTATSPSPTWCRWRSTSRCSTRARAALGELPADRAQRYERELGLSAESARLLAFRAELGDYFEVGSCGAVDPPAPAQALANWIASDLLSRLGEGEDPAGSRVRRDALAALVGLVSAKRISVGAGRQVLDRLVAAGRRPGADRRSAEGLEAIGGSEELAGVVAAALAANPEAAQRVREGNAKAIGPIVGHVMRETQGRADGGEVARLVHEQLGV